jgi:hypothetical protein
MTHANLEYLPISQGGAGIFAPHPYHRVRTDTENIKCGTLVRTERNNRDLPAQCPGPAVRFWPAEQLPRQRGQIRALLYRHYYRNQYDYEGRAYQG